MTTLAEQLDKDLKEARRVIGGMAAGLDNVHKAYTTQDELIAKLTAENATLKTALGKCTERREEREAIIDATQAALDGLYGGSLDEVGQPLPIDLLPPDRQELFHRVLDAFEREKDELAEDEDDRLQAAFDNGRGGGERTGRIEY